MKRLIVVVALGLSCIVPRQAVAEHAAEAPANVVVPADGFAEIETFMVLASMFWPAEGGCCPDMAKHDRCHLWDGYCTMGQCLACEPGFVPLLDQLSQCLPGRGSCKCDRCAATQCQGNCGQGNCGQGNCGTSSPTQAGQFQDRQSQDSPFQDGRSYPVNTVPSAPILIPTPEQTPTPADEFPRRSPRMEPTPEETVLPPNVIPTRQRIQTARRPGDRVAQRETTRSVLVPSAVQASRPPFVLPTVPQVESASAQPVIVPVTLRSAPPLPEQFDYYLPSSLRDAVRSNDVSPLAKQFDELTGA